jgi:hypothetical protein
MGRLYELIQLLCGEETPNDRKETAWCAIGWGSMRWHDRAHQICLWNWKWWKEGRKINDDKVEAETRAKFRCRGGSAWWCFAAVVKE